MGSKYTLLPLQEVLIKDRFFVYVHRLQANRDIPHAGVVAGELGGYVSGEDVLSQEGECWISGYAVVLNSTIKDNALVKHNAFIQQSIVDKEAVVAESANVEGFAYITDHAKVVGNAYLIGGEEEAVILRDHATVSGTAKLIFSSLSDDVRVWGNASVRNSVLSDHANVSGRSAIKDSTLTGNVQVSEDAGITESTLKDNVCVYGDAKIFQSTLEGNTQVKDIAQVYKSNLSGQSYIYGTAKVNEITAEGFTSEGDSPYVNIAMRLLIEDPDEEKDDAEEAPVNTAPSLAPSWDEEAMVTLEEIEASQHEYANDLLLMSQYPSMSDVTTSADARQIARDLRKVYQVIKKEDIVRLVSAVETLEDSFMIAEANAKRDAYSPYPPEVTEKFQDAHRKLSEASKDSLPASDREKLLEEATAILREFLVVPSTAQMDFRQKHRFPVL